MALRVVELVVPQDAASAWKGPSEEVPVIDWWREPLPDRRVRLRVLVESEKSEAIIQELESQFQSVPDFRLLIIAVEATVPQPVDTDDNEDEPEDKAAAQKHKDPRRIACAELVEKLSGGVTVDSAHVLTVILATVVAAIGLINDSVTVIIGAMVIAPFLGPNMTLSLATTLGHSKLARRALWAIGTGMGFGFLLAVLMGLTISFDPHVRQISSRTVVSLSNVGIAFAAGSAGALAFTAGLSEALVGVMVSVALLPPLVAAGLLLGAGQFHLAAGALLLLATNVIGVNLAGVATFLWQDVRPRYWWEAERAKRMVRVAGGIWLALLVALLALIYLSGHW
jgi:uncharacterized hydrophobic protein (TIGR00341 family)